jgi:hypothetical protein
MNVHWRSSANEREGKPELCKDFRISTVAMKTSKEDIKIISIKLNNKLFLSCGNGKK